MKIIKVSKILLLLLFVFLAIFVTIGIFLPSVIIVEKSITINSKPAEIHPLVNNLQNWPKWVSWSKRDPDLINIYEGSEKGEGSIYKWSGNKDVGSGMITIVESDTNKGIWYNLSFEDKNNVHKGFLIYQEEDTTTNVKWGLEVEVGGNIFNKYKGVMFKPYLERDFDSSLSELKKLVEMDTSLINNDELTK